MSGIVVHHLNNSRSQRILWLLEELNVPYEIKHYQRGPDQRAPKELKDVHPLGKSPVITDNGKVIAESGVIVDYLIKKYGNGKFLPKDEGKAYDDNYWSHFAEGSLMPALVLKLIFQIIPGQAPFIVRPLVYAVTIAVNRQFVDPEVNTKIAYVADEIAKNGGGWFAGGDKDGDPTTADFQMAFPLEAAAASRMSNLPEEIQPWVAKVHQRPAYKRALEKGGPYNYHKA